MQSYGISFLLLRLAVGMSMFGHGLVRLPKLSEFSAGMVADFQESMIPEILVLPMTYVIPIAELIIGILLLLGLFTRLVLIAGGVLMIVLIFGVSMVENWGALPSQMIHSLFFAGLIPFLSHNVYSLDYRLRGGRGNS